MDINQNLALLGGISPQQFMKQYWQKKPLLIRQAIPNFQAPLDRQTLFKLAANADVESRLVTQTLTKRSAPSWAMQRGPFGKKSQQSPLPPLTQAQWTLLVQGVDGHHPAVHALLQQFRFVPDARLDDVMVSYATTGGGVGPHFDSYDVFLLQAHGQRRWRIGRQKDLSLLDGVPLKILAQFEPEEEWVLEPGDMLYLPPRYAHDGVALNECMTYSIGFSAPQKEGLALALLQTMMDEMVEDHADASSTHAPTLYKDPKQAATPEPALIPPDLQAFAQEAVTKALKEVAQLPRLLGEHLTEPKAHVQFTSSGDFDSINISTGVRLDAKTRMMYDEQHVFINGDSYRAAGRDAVLMRRLANQRQLSAAELAKASADARQLLSDWCESGWVHGQSEST
jgi:50S ribosomal protein L16 3-hydroxylase